MERPPAWSELRVVQLGDRVACAWAAKLLTELGADCVLVERPDGDGGLRHQGGAGSGAEHGLGPLFTHLHWGKRSVALDYADDDGLDRLACLAAGADVLVRERLPGSIEEAWQARREALDGRLIELVVSPFGESGPYAGYVADSGAILALSGNTYTNGDPDREPLTTQPQIAEYMAGSEGFVAILAALHRRRRDGEGSRIELSLLDSAVAFDEYNLMLPAASGVVRTRFYSRLIFSYPSNIFRCRDGSVMFVGSVTIPNTPLLIDRPDLLDTPLFTDTNYRAEHWKDVEALLVPWFAERPRDEVVERAQEVRLSVSPVLSIGELVEHPHVAHRRTIRRGRDAAGEVALTAPPFRLASYRAPERPTPLRGGHSAEVLGALPEAKPLPAGPAQRDPSAEGLLPLSGVRVLDFTHIWAGPCCTRILADLGAEVIKVEGPGHFDATRPLFLMENDPAGEFWNHSAYFQNRNQNKLDVAVDLSREEGRDLVGRLVPHCDVLVENFTPRVMSNFGLDWPVVSKLNPRLVMVSMGGYGADGPFANHSALGFNIDGSCGLSGGNGYPGGDPIHCGTAILDPFAGVSAAAAALAALLERERTGEGQHVDLSQHETAMNLVGEWIVEHARTGREPERRGNRSAHHAPQGIYRCAGDDAWIYVSVRGEEQWRRFCEVLDAPALAEDPRFAAVEQRLAHHDLLDEQIATFTRARQKRALMEALQRAGVIAAAVLDAAEVLADPHLHARGTFETVEVGEPPRPYPSQRYVPARFDRFDVRSARRAPRLGEHNRAVFQDLCGVADEELTTLEEHGVLATEPVLALPIEQMREAIRFPTARWVEWGIAKPAP